MLPVLLASAKGEVRIGEVINKLGTELNLTSQERLMRLPSGRQGLFENRVHWAKFYLVKASLLESTRRGYNKITARGQQVLNSNPPRIDNIFLNQFEEFKKFRESSVQSETEVVTLGESFNTTRAETPDETMRSAHGQIEASLAQDLLDRILLASPDFFERLIVNLLISMGYGGSAAGACRAIGRSGDDGVDGVIDQDALGLDRVYIQAKRYKQSNSIGSPAMRDFFGSLDRHKAAKGLFVTTSTFSTAAKETVELLSKRIVLIDGNTLTALMIRHNVGCRVEETLHIKKIDEDFFE